jgi:hypothetical protein
VLAALMLSSAASGLALPADRLAAGEPALTGSFDVRDFGAVPNDGIDDTRAIQRAIDAAEALAQPPNVHVPVGVYDVSTLTIRRTVLVGAGRGRPMVGMGAPTTLRHTAGATGHLIEIVPDDPHSRNVAAKRLFGGVHSMYLQGRREQNLRRPSRILSAASRHSFAVDPRDLAGRELPTNVEPFPHYGLLYFDSADDQYLGHGIATSIDTRTGEVSLLKGWDNYATTTGASNRLTTAEQVVFSGVYTSASYPALNGRADASLAGYGAINVGNDVIGVALDDLAISNFHFGIARGDGRVIEARNIWMAFNTHGIVSRSAGGSDNYWNRVFIQGYYGPDPGRTATTQAFDNVEYRDQAAGIWLLASRDVYIDLTVDRAVNGIVDSGGYQWYMSNVLLDLPTKYGFLSYHGGRNGDSAFGSIGTLSVSTPTTLPAVLDLPTRTRAVIALMSPTIPRWLSVGHLSTLRFPGASTVTAFPVLTSIAAGNRIDIGTLAMDSGVDAIASDSDGEQPAIGHVNLRSGAAVALPPVTKSQLEHLAESRSGWLAFQRDAGQGLRVYENGAWRSKPTVLEQSAVPVVAPGNRSRNSLRSIVVPGGAMGPNGSLRITALFSVAGNGAGKRLRVTMQGVDLVDAVVSSAGSVYLRADITNRGDEKKQVSVYTTASSGDREIVDTRFAEVDTAAPATIEIQAQKTDPLDSIVLEKYTLELIVP